MIKLRCVLWHITTEHRKSFARISFCYAKFAIDFLLEFFHTRILILSEYTCLNKGLGTHILELFISCKIKEHHSLLWKSVLGLLCLWISILTKLSQRVMQLSRPFITSMIATFFVLNNRLMGFITAMASYRLGRRTQLSNFWHWRARPNAASSSALMCLSCGDHDCLKDWEGGREGGRRGTDLVGFWMPLSVAWVRGNTRRTPPQRWKVSSVTWGLVGKKSPLPVLSCCHAASCYISEIIFIIISYSVHRDLYVFITDISETCSAVGHVNIKQCTFV